jgi:hypothetical protein
MYDYRPLGACAELRAALMMKPPVNLYSAGVCGAQSPRGRFRNGPPIFTIIDAGAPGSGSAGDEPLQTQSGHRFAKIVTEVAMDFRADLLRGKITDAAHFEKIRGAVGGGQ